MRIIIFDFNWTLYNPDAESLVPDAIKVLKKLRERGFLLYILTKTGKNRTGLIYSLGIRKYFRRVIVSPEKKEEDIAQFIKKDRRIERASSYMVGDRVRKEILYGNRLGFQTVWVRGGRFADEIPHDVSENPAYIVADLRDILKLIY